MSHSAFDYCSIMFYIASWKGKTFMPKTLTADKPNRNRKTKTQLMEEEIRRRADYSLVVLGMAFMRNGSGKFLNIRAHGDRLKKAA